MERRTHKRFQAQDGAFAVLRVPQNNSTNRVGQIIDIGMGGLSFYYIASDEPTREASELKIIFATDDFCLDKVPSSTVADFETGKDRAFTSITMRRSGLRFGQLTQSQTVQLEHFIEHHTQGEV